MPSTNLFANAKVVKPATKGKSAAKPVVEIEGLETVAAIDHAIKMLTALKKTVEAPVKAVASQHFIAEGILTGKQPESFDAKDGVAKANIQCKQRASNSGLSDVEEAMCLQYNVPLGTSGGEFFFPAEHQEWVLKNSPAISKAFEKLKAPAGIIAQQPTKVITTEESISHVFKAYQKAIDEAKAAKVSDAMLEAVEKEQRNLIEQLLPMVAVVALKPKFKTGDEEADDSALAAVQKYLNPDEDEEVSAAED